jgi:DNA-binding transcriptional regulator YiaG
MEVNMGKIATIKDALDEANRLLLAPKYQTLEEAQNISKILIVQIELLELKSKYKLSNDDIALGVGVTEKTVRMWLKGNHCPKSEHFQALKEFYDRKAIA